jgi:hypothetical protein
MKKIFQFVFQIKYVRTLIVLLLISLPFIGSDCQSVLTPTNEGGIIGQWRLIHNDGTNHDICPGEYVTFESNGQAQLQCPDQPVVIRHYTLSGSTLTYTESSVEYTIAGMSANQMELVGYGRDLYYDKIVITDKNNTGAGTDGMNSSEKGSAYEK